MVIFFHQLDSVWQTVTLVASQFTMIFLSAVIILLFVRRYRLLKLIATAGMFLINASLYVLMQLESRITWGDTVVKLEIPYIIPMICIPLFLLIGLWLLFSEMGKRKTINNTSIKEAFDNLPIGVCFFNETGLPVLCNQAMQRFSFAVCGKDIQFITDLESILSDDSVLLAGVMREAGNVFVLIGGAAWQLEKGTFTNDSDKVYIQYTATDVTDLHEKRVELMNETEELRRVQLELKKLSANIVTVTREEEILNTKMRVHDEMGRCLVAAQKYLREDSTESIPDSLAMAWQRAVSMLKYNNEISDEDMLLQIRKTCESVKLEFVQRGELPWEEDVAYILTCAVRECVTNAVRYADAVHLYADFSEGVASATVAVTNDGKIPEGEIVEGGGLSTLRRRVERAGGTMTVESAPAFKLTVTVPKGRGGVI